MVALINHLQLSCVCQAWNDVGSGSLLVNLWLLMFQLLGVNSQTYTYSRQLLVLLTVVCDDFAVYFFTFILTHSIILISAS